MTGDEDDNFDFDLTPEPRPAALTEADEIVAENAPESHEITDVDFHELDLP